jgi:hypothetical protein
VDRQRVHVGPQCDPRPVRGSRNVDDDAGAARAARRESERLETRADAPGGALLLPCQLGMAVQVATEGDQALEQLGCDDR